MNTTTTTAESVHHSTRETAAKWIAGGSALEAVGAIATIALAIVGLAGVFSSTMAAIATIVVGAAMLLEGGSAGSTEYLSRGTGFEAMEVTSGGLSAAFLGGVAGIVLGILALLGISSQTLLSVAVLAFGASYLLTGVAASQSRFLVASAGGQVFVGLAAAVLGILAVIGIDPLILVLVGLLAVGTGTLFSGSAHTARMGSEIRRYPEGQPAV